jgi:hypothetical protein
MTAPAYTREALAHGVVRLSAKECQFAFSRPRPGILLVHVAGHDYGQFGTGTLDEIVNALTRERPLELFVDTRQTVSVSTRVREEWTRFFTNNRAQLIAVHVLTSSKIIHLAVAVAQLFSNTGNLIRLYSKPEVFEARLHDAQARSGLSPRPH